MAQTPPPAIRPPVMLGCTAIVAAAGLVVLAVILGAVFLDSGADSGDVVLEPAGFYSPGSVTRIADRGFYVVRLPDGTVLALSDLDAANRAASDRRCRVAVIAAGDPALPALLARYRNSFSDAAAGASLVFREDCHGALYDPAGIRLDADGPNLDRYVTKTNGDGRLVVSLARRTCTRRDGGERLVNIDCPQ